MSYGALKILSIEGKMSLFTIGDAEFEPGPMDPVDEKITASATGGAVRSRGTPFTGLGAVRSWQNLPRHLRMERTEAD